MAGKRRPIDWAEIEREYRETATPIRDLARWHRVAESGIRARAKRHQWTRRAQADVRRPAPMGAPAAPAPGRVSPVPPEMARPEAILGRGRGLVLRMLDELEATTAHLGEIEAAIIGETADDDGGRRREALLKAVSLPARAGTLKALALAAKTLAEAALPDGKKAQQADTAAKLAQGGGRFAAPAPPKLVVSNS
ncbi:hypothetical protein [Methylobacterium nodulans]|uniref:Terminase small subunit n=1 Tax=Methylobacterium nodulans (strain LMG 21967 / CNCM I-2342 / ORS 2060) TaxID=460265 RepID=B8ITP5_METNO|nr:hypothetical protein [Methylobacterium nodulans]ACL58961.1 hypothetical protein Mnod_4082 [Methylobacterium nodulans ORS 2060]